LQLVRDTVAKSIGASEFTNSATRDQMLEAELRSSTESSADLEIDWQRKLELAESFLAAVRPFFVCHHQTS
jgi:hypothetical protein